MKNAKLDNFYDSTSKPYTGLVINSCYVDKTPVGKHHHRDGIVIHEQTIARFHANRFDNQADPNKNRRYTTISVVKDGVEYSREWKGYYGKKTISRLANIFIEEIFGGGKENCNPSLFTPAQVREIRSSSLDDDTLARKFNRSKSTINKIKNRISYKDIE